MSKYSEQYSRNVEHTKYDPNVWTKTGPEKDDIIEGGEEWFETLYGHLTN